MLVRIIGVREKFGTFGYTINDSIYHSLNNLYLDDIQLEAMGDTFYAKSEGIGQIRPVEAKELGNIYGMTCCGSDVNFFSFNHSKHI
jgi:hypothetical protein